MIISFRLTEEQFLAGIKTETRRLWKPRTVALYKRGTLHVAYSNLPFCPDARKLGTIVATADAFLERLEDITQESVVKEGFPEMTTDDFIRFFIDEARKQGHKKFDERVELAVAKFQKL